MEMRIRRADTTDAKAIADILRELGWFPHLNDEPHSSTLARVSSHLELCSSGKSHSVYVAETENSEVIGYVSVHWLPYLFLQGPEGYVSELFVKASARGKGVGGSLLAVVESEARERGCSRLMLINGRNRESYQRNFYEKHGWQEREQAANFVYQLT